MGYYIHNYETDKGYKDPDTNNVELYDTSEIASKVCSNLRMSNLDGNMGIGVSLDLDVVEESFWLKKYRNHSLPVWIISSHFTTISTHMCTVCKENPKLVEFTETSKKGRLGIRTQMTPGKYLNKYHKDELSKKEIEYYANKHREIHVTSLEVKFGKTPDEFEKVYSMPSKTFTSCMQGSKYRFGSRSHPCRSYGYGDLEVAYLEKDGNLIARALVWRKKKTLVGRMYGDEFALRSALRDIGIETDSTYDDYDSLIGARLLKDVQRKRNFEGDTGTYKYYIIPYIDGDRAIDDCGDFLKIDKQGDYVAISDTGLMKIWFSCPICGNIVLPKDSIYVFHNDGYGDLEYEKYDNVCRNHRLDTPEAIIYIKDKNPFPDNTVVYDWCSDSYLYANEFELVWAYNDADIEIILNANAINKKYMYKSDLNGRTYYTPHKEKVILATGECYMYSQVEGNTFISEYDEGLYPLTMLHEVNGLKLTLEQSKNPKLIEHVKNRVQEIVETAELWEFKPERVRYLQGLWL